MTFLGLFGIHAKQSVLSWTVCHVSLLHHHCHCMWTVSHFTGLIAETIFCMHMHIWAWYIHAYQIFSQCDLHFYNDSHFAFFLYFSLLPTWFNLELSYLAQICICSWVTHTEGNMHLWSIFLKLQFFFKKKCNIHQVFWDCNELWLLATITYIL